MTPSRHAWTVGGNASFERKFVMRHMAGGLIVADLGAKVFGSLHPGNRHRMPGDTGRVNQAVKHRVSLNQAPGSGLLSA